MCVWESLNMKLLKKKLFQCKIKAFSSEAQGNPIKFNNPSFSIYEGVKIKRKYNENLNKKKSKDHCWLICEIKLISFESFKNLSQIFLKKIFKAK